MAAVAIYNHAIEVTRREGDAASREMLEKLLRNKEEHVDLLEAQIHRIREIGYV